MPNSSRRFRRFLLTASAVALSVVAGTLTAPAIAAPAALDDSFYVPPAELSGAPGDIIRARPSRPGTATEIADAWQIMYRSTDALGEPNAVTGTVLVPKGVDPATAPVVGFAAGTQGPAFRCAPSKMLQGQAFYEQPALDGLLRSGYAVAMTDYEGYSPEPATSYIVGRSEGHAVLDAVRAALRLPEAGLSDQAPVALRGYSQGGGAVMWAGQQQPDYAPELDLVGVAGGGVPADLVQVALPLEGKFGFGFLAYALIGLDNAYPELDLDSYLNDRGRAEFAKMEQNACTLELLIDYAGDSLSEYTTSSPVLTPPWLARVGENKLGGSAIPAPVLQYHASGDELVAPGQAETLRDDYCGLGMSLTWKAYDTDHITLVHTGSADALAFLADRFAGKPATSTC
ncbi:Secretory lipase [Amycolatopsis marina]|uniref:Secretory lipase n=1 Tax=Amycolatopsis marina TaxID=490629 RepID=A0A1I0XJH5_9PSEU|nr:lipase family protein [Amycolatopsis marina]SFB01152.1 Secretory lipase [Amycolatopsis marina]